MLVAGTIRHILFFPDDTQAAYYSSLVADPPEGSSLEHPQRALQVIRRHEVHRNWQHAFRDFDLRTD